MAALVDMSLDSVKKLRAEGRDTLARAELARVVGWGPLHRAFVGVSAIEAGDCSLMPDLKAVRDRLDMELLHFIEVSHPHMLLEAKAALTPPKEAAA